MAHCREKFNNFLLHYRDLLNNYSSEDTESVNTLFLEKSLEEERTKELSELKTLSKKVCNLHTNILYYRNADTKRGAACYEAWKTLVRKIGGSPDTWRDLGYVLGVAQDDLNYIKNSMREDPADVVLKVYIQNEAATLDKIIDALEKLKRYDILKAIEEPFCNLSQYFNKKDDSGYQSANKSPSKRNIFYMNNLIIDLPPALNNNYIIKEEDKQPNMPSVWPFPNTESKEIESDCPILFLTYTEDGLQTALNIQRYTNEWEDLRVVVLTLTNKKEQVYHNPEKFIREYFQKAHFIVPIITRGYLSRIKPNTEHVHDTNDNLEYKYVKFIYNLIINHYIHGSGCLNDKVRSVLPLNADISVLKEITMYPDLLPYTYESNFNDHFKAFLKK